MLPELFASPIQRRGSALITRLLPKAERERYAKKETGERWITLNGDSGEGGNGGTPVKVDDDGKIVSGPQGLADKGVQHLDDFGGKKKKAGKPKKATAADAAAKKKGFKDAADHQAFKDNESRLKGFKDAADEKAFKANEKRLKAKPAADAPLHSEPKAHESANGGLSPEEFASSYSDRGQGGPRGTFKTQELLSDPNAGAILAEVPKGSRVLGSGKDAVAMETPDGDVVRISRNEGSRPNLPEVLQATSSKQVGGWTVERLPKAEVPRFKPDDEGMEFIAKMEEEGRSPGGRFTAKDLTYGNVGKVDGEWKIIDPSAIEMRGEPAKAEQPTAPAPTPDAIHAAAQRLDPDAYRQGSMVSLTDLRKEFPGVSKADFDKAILGLDPEQHGAFLAKHDYPSSLKPHEREGLVQEGDSHFNTISFEPKAGAAQETPKTKGASAHIEDSEVFKRTGAQFERLQQAMGFGKPVMGPKGAERVRKFLAKHPGGAVIAAALGVDGSETQYDSNGFAERGQDAYAAAIDGKFTKPELDAARQWFVDTFNNSKELANVNQYRWISGTIQTAKPKRDDPPK